MINRLGIRRPASRLTRNNYLNHRKFYEFAAQFAGGNRAADIGCGSGYGCAILDQAGASAVSGCDLSKRAIRFARARYLDAAVFSVQGNTELHGYAANEFDLTICSEVLEHIKEYGKDAKALRELFRITRAGGVVVVGTPNTEMYPDHGFSFDELDDLFSKQAEQYVIFENALVPAGERAELWGRRSKEGRTGVVVSQLIDFSETYLPDPGARRVKEGAAPGEWRLGPYRIDTTLLHNTHSWVVVALAGGESWRAPQDGAPRRQRWRRAT